MLFTITVTKEPKTYEIVDTCFDDAYKRALMNYEIDPETKYCAVVSGPVKPSPLYFRSWEVESIVSKLRKEENI